jgi:hypothetical protein
MQNISSNQKKHLYEGGHVGVTITGETLDGTPVTVTEDDIIEGSFSIDRNWVSGSTIEIGCAETSELVFELDNTDGQWSDLRWEGTRLVVVLDIAGEPLQAGIFVVDEPPRKLTTMAIRALDNMARFNRLYDSTCPYPTTLLQILQDACSKCGVTLYTQAFDSSNYVVAQRPEGDDITYHHVVAWVAELAGCNAWIDEYGRLRLSWYGENQPADSPPEVYFLSSDMTGQVRSYALSIGPNDRFSYEAAEGDIEITGIVYRTEETDYLAGSDKYALIIEENPLLQENYESVLSSLLTKLGGFKYRPYKFETLGYPHLWPGDVITKLIDAERNETASIITNHTYKLNGNSVLEAKGETEAVRGYATGAPFTPSQKRVLQAVAKVEAARQTSALEQATLQLNELMVNSLGFYTTTVELEAGAKTVYTHDKPALEDSTVIWTRTEQGFAWTDQGWNNGSPVWQYGVTSDGSAIVKLLTAVGINADWINVTDLTALSSDDGYTRMVGSGVKSFDPFGRLMGHFGRYRTTDQASFIRGSEAYLPDGTKVTAEKPRFVPDNLALGKPVTTNGEINKGTLSMVTDGCLVSSAHLDIRGDDSPKYVVVDLGTVKAISEIRVWHYHADGRIYKNTKTEVSKDGVAWEVVFDSATKGTYKETATGHRISFDTKEVRYVRDWVNGSDKNNGNHWVEIQVLSPFKEGVLIEEGTSNLVSNGGFETWASGAPTGWATGFFSTGTIYPDNKNMRSGSYCIKLATTSADSSSRIMQAVTVSTDSTYTLSVEAKASTSSEVGIYAFNSSYAVLGSERVTLSPGKNYIKIQVSFKTGANSQVIVAIYPTMSGTPGNVWIDNVQLEKKSQSTTFMDGTRVNEELYIPGNLLNPTEGEVEGRFRVSDKVVQGLVSHTILGNWNYPGYGKGLHLGLTKYGDTQEFGFSLGDKYGYFESPIELEEGTLVDFKLKWDAQKIKILINGIIAIEESNQGNEIVFGDELYIGSNNGVGGFLNAVFDDIRVSNKCRSDEDDIDAYLSGEPLSFDSHTTAKLDFDGSLDYQTVKYGLGLFDAHGSRTFGVDDEGNLRMIGSFVTFSGGQKALEMTHQIFNLYDWEGTTRVEPVGALYSARESYDPAKPGVVLANKADAYMALSYALGATFYSYIDFDKDGVLGLGLGEPITIWENVRIEDSLRFGGYEFWGGADGAIVLARTGGVNHMQVYYAGAAHNYYDIVFYRNVLCDTNLHVNGAFNVSGAKNALHKTEHYGERLVSAYETAEYYFGDIGFGTINQDGECIVSIDDIFSECVNTDIEYHVFTQVYNGAIASIDRQKTYFTIYGTPGTEFSWELKAKRRGYEHHRLEVPESEPPVDPVSFDDLKCDNQVVTDILEKELTYQLDDYLLS